MAIDEQPMADRERTKMPGRAVFSLIGFFSLLAVVMFLPAGMGWWKGWLFLAVFLLQMAIAAVYIWRTNPDLFIARSRMQKGTKGWDRVLFYVLQVVMLAAFPVAALRRPIPLVVGPSVGYCSGLPPVHCRDGRLFLGAARKQVR